MFYLHYCIQTYSQHLLHKVYQIEEEEQEK